MRLFVVVIDVGSGKKFVWELKEISEGKGK